MSTNLDRGMAQSLAKPMYYVSSLLNTAPNPSEPVKTTIPTKTFRSDAIYKIDLVGSVIHVVLVF